MKIAGLGIVTPEIGILAIDEMGRRNEQKEERTDEVSGHDPFGMRLEPQKTRTEVIKEGRDIGHPKVDKLPPETGRLSMGSGIDHKKAEQPDAGS